MTDYATLKLQIAEWANRTDWSDALVSSFITMAESKFNQELRVAQMIEFSDGIITSRCAQLPDDWLAMDMVRVANTNGADGFLPARYKSRDEFFTLTDSNSWMYYTLVGTTMFFGGTPEPVDGTAYWLSYYGEVPTMSDTQTSWIYQKHPQLYLFASLMHADLHAVGEEQQAGNLKALAEDIIQKLNAAHMGSKASGSRVTMPRNRTFG
jgi:hypothetical protein